VLALEAMGVDSIVVANRSQERARALTDSLMPAPVITISLDGSALWRELARADILVNATSVGWRPNEAPLELGLLATLPRHALVVDLTYRQTELLSRAMSLGLEAIDGLPMLVHQGAAAFELFTGQRPPIETMFAAAEEARRQT
jgi:shikimate dehydrogenase